MAELPPSVPRRVAQSNAHGDRLGEYHTGRSPPAQTSIWGSVSHIGATLQGVGVSDDSYGAQLSAPGEQQAVVSQIIPSEAWNPLPWTPEASTSVAAAQPGEALARQPPRIRGNQYEPPKNPGEIPRSSSPFFPRQAYPQLGKPVNNGADILAPGPSYSDGTRGLGQPVSAINRYIPEGSYPQYSGSANHQYNAPQQAGSHTQQFIPGFGYPRQRFEDARDTRDFERTTIQQFRDLRVDSEEADHFNTVGSRNAYPTFTQPQLINPLPASFQSQPQAQYNDFQSYPSRQTHSMWNGPQDAAYAGGDNFSREPTYTEGYGDQQTMKNVRKIGMMSGAEVQSRNQTSQIYPNGELAQRAFDNHAQNRVATTAQQHGPGQLPVRDQSSFQRPPQYGLHYQYPPYNAIRLPTENHYQAPPIGAVVPPANPTRHEDYTHNLRSLLLEEFRSNSKLNKRYELKDIYTHVVEFSGDQHGSRFIQQKLETANSDEKETVFNEIHPNCLQLMTDVFGNYVIQKFFEHGSQLQKSTLAKQMEGHVLTLSLQMYGCRVVQKALEHILVDQQAALVKELDGHVLKCVKDQNGNHVVQKAIERVPAEHIQFIINSFTKQVQSLATHPYGCRVIQRMLEHCDAKAQAALLEELHLCTYTLVQDQYGNYVTQHVIEQGKPEDRAKIIQLVTTQLLHFSKHKFASNVVEKSIAHGNDEQRREIVKVITTPRPDGTSPLQVLMRDQFGNYVIQKLLMQLKGKDRDVLVDQIKPQLQALKKFTHGKQISAIEKLIYNSSTPPNSQSATPPPGNGAGPSNSSTIPPPKSAPHNRKGSSMTSTTLKATSKEFNGTSGDGKSSKGPGKTDGAPF